MASSHPDGTEPLALASSEAFPVPADWNISLRFWLERAGKSILGPGRLDLLEGIARLHSISAAAREMKMSYRRAWELVQGINEAAGEPLVVASTGGTSGGGARLTPLGRWAVHTFRDVQGLLHRTAAGMTPRLQASVGPCTLHVAVAVSLEEVIGQLLLDYASQVPDLRVRTVHGASDELADQVLAGAPADLFLTADATQIDRLVQAQRTPGHPQVVLAENGLAAICLTDRSPRVRQAADLARLPGPIALAHASCPLGRYTRDYLTGLQLYEAVAQRALWVENARGAITAIRSGLAEVALAYTSDAARAEGCRVLYRARQLPTPIRYRGVGLRSGESTAAADRLLTFLASPHAATLFRRCGFRNVPRD